MFAGWQLCNAENHNLLLVCQGINKEGIPFYEDKSARYGLDFSGFSTQAAFFDYDMDGDLDMFLLNHSLRYNSTFQPRANLRIHLTLFQETGFTEMREPSLVMLPKRGINSSVIGYGLGICVSDINLDGYPGSLYRQ